MGAEDVDVGADPLTALEILRRSTDWLQRRGIESARLDAEILVAHGLELSRLELYLHFDRPMTEAELTRVRALIQERGRHVPVAYLTGEREFYSLPFHVDPRVLVPRPETEHVVEEVLRVLDAGDDQVFADVGTGSGCIAVTVLHALPGARGHATDISAGALVVARRNAERHGVADRLRLHEGDVLEPLRGGDDWGRLDVVVSNPPYVLASDPNVDVGVREHEPREAVFVPGDDAEEVVRRVADVARDGLRPGGSLIVEIGYGSAPATRALLAELGYGEIRVSPDLAGIDRVVSAVRG